MSKTFTLEPLIHLTEHQHDSASRKLGQLNQRQQRSEQQLATLLNYRRDYQQRLQQAIRNGIDPASLRNFEQFISRLDDAINQQNRVVEQSKASVQQGRNEFNEVQRKLQSFNTLQQRHLEQQQKQADKAEQKMLDEHSGRFASYKNHQ